MPWLVPPMIIWANTTAHEACTLPLVIQYFWETTNDELSRTPSLDPPGLGPRGPADLISTAPEKC